MTDELEDWQLALLVEARRYDDPVIVEAHEAQDLQDAQDLLEQAEPIDNPVVVDHSVKQTYDEAEDLLEAASGISDWEVVPSDQREDEQEALEAVEELLSDALKEHHDLRDAVVDAMSAPQMVAQFRDEDDGEIELEALAQQPETGGADTPADDGGSGDGGSAGAGGSGDGGDGGADPLEDLSLDERRTVADKLDRAEMMDDRTPEYADTLRQEAADIVGVESADDINTEAL